MSSLFSIYPQFPISFVRAKGTTLWDEHGNEYIDFYSGIGCVNLGHNNKNVTEALTKQAEQLWHVSNIFLHHNTQRAATKLASKTPFDNAKVFFGNSGAEANEAAIKLARRYTKQKKGSDAVEIISFEKSFHGRTLATLSCTGKKKMREDFAPLFSGVHFAEYNNIDSVKNLINKNTSAIIIEIIQGEGGLQMADVSFVKELRDICNEHNIVLIVDEIQTGTGRTGTFFVCEQYGVLPDIITAAKGIGNGFPVGAMIAQSHIAEAFVVGDHGTTFGGNPLATAVVGAVCDTITDDFLNTVQKKSKIFDMYLQALAKKHTEKCIEIRGTGMMRGIVLSEGIAKKIQNILLKQHHIVTLLAGDGAVLRLLPPLIISEEQLEHVVHCISSVIEEC